MTLSIVVITMNRAEQLRSALLSCALSDLPEDVEFIIIDNASIDNTKTTVHDFFSEYKYPYIYELEEANLGVGGGRNRGFDLANGEFVYFLDDDAIIAPESYNSFFKVPIAAFRNDETIASITTRIYDELLASERTVQCSKNSTNDSITEVFMYLGGSHFLRRQYYERPLYLDFKYGMEELLPSIYVIDKGLKNCYIHQINVIHQPKQNKWKTNSNEKKSIVIDYNVNSYVSKQLIYPFFFQPILFIAYICRTIRHFGFNFQVWSESFKRLALQKHKIHIKARKVNTKTVFLIVRNYSLGAAF